jgi:uncharacterized lipoprotein YehR (DUF1307 family)
MKIVEANDAHKVAFEDLGNLLAKHGQKVDAAQMLAIAANMIGKMIALQDERTMTSERALEIVRLNLQKGNVEAMALIQGKSTVLNCKADERGHGGCEVCGSHDHDALRSFTGGFICPRPAKGN